MFEQDQAYSAGGIVLAGCLFVGVGVGIFVGQWIVGTVIGFGVGLLAMGLMVGRRSPRRKDTK